MADPMIHETRPAAWPAQRGAREAASCAVRDAPCRPPADLLLHPGAAAGHPRPVPSPSTCAGEAPRPPRRLSVEAFTVIAAPIIARGGTWTEVAKAAGLDPNTCRQRGHRAGLRSMQRGRPVGSAQSEETKARISAAQRARWALR